MLAYNQPRQPLETMDKPGGGAKTWRTTKITYDAAGRERQSKTIEGGGQSIPKVETLAQLDQWATHDRRLACGECDTQASRAS